MSNETIAKVLRNLGCTCHHPTLVKNSFYSGRRANYKLEAMLQIRPGTNGMNIWELVDPDGKILLPISFQNRESAMACLASDDFNTVYNFPGYDVEHNYKTLAREFGGFAW